MRAIDNGQTMKELWSRLFLEERPSIGLSFFRIFVALATGFHVLPLFFHLDENYLRTAFKTLHYNFFTSETIAFIQNSPDWLVAAFAGLFCVVWFCFLIGYVSQFSCILMTATCYYFYALNAFYMGRPKSLSFSFEYHLQEQRLFSLE